MNLYAKNEEYKPFKAKVKLFLEQITYYCREALFKVKVAYRMFM